MIRNFHFFAAVLFIPLAALFATEPVKPNIVMIIGDDFGVYYSQPYGAREIRTPNMQRMADEGMLFHRAYVASPSCAPSRAALFTGREPYNNGIVGNHEKILKPGVQSLLPHLTAQGYDILWCGKVGHGPVPYKSLGVSQINSKNSPLDISDVERRLSLRKDKSRPIAIFLGDMSTHTPWPKAEEARISHNDVVLPPKTYDTPEARTQMARYVEGVEKFDGVVGRAREMVAKHLDPNNTMVVLSSDHGAAWPFGKWTLYETGIRTPLMIVWPGKVKPGSSTKAMVSWIDIIPTFIDVAGGTEPPGIDGKSIKRILLGEIDTHRDRIFCTHKGDQTKAVYPCRSVGTEDWKYILNLHPEFCYSSYLDTTQSNSAHYFPAWPTWVSAAQTDPVAAAFLRAYHIHPAEELYHVKEDPYENKNLASMPEHREMLEKMRAMVRSRMKEVGDDESLSGPPILLKDVTLPPGGK